VRIESPGGGGWGDPMARDLERVLRDVRLGYVSQAVAREQYGVVITAEGAIDSEATRLARAKAAR
jgi:N-methylhydantoinase B